MSTVATARGLDRTAVEKLVREVVRQRLGKSVAALGRRPSLICG